MIMIFITQVPCNTLQHLLPRDIYIFSIPDTSISRVTSETHRGAAAVSHWDTDTLLVFRPLNNGKEVPRWGVAEIKKMSLPTTGRCYQTREWGQPTNGSAARRHGSQSQHYSFFGVVDRTLTQFFWSTGWEVISKFPSQSSLRLAVTLVRVIVKTGLSRLSLNMPQPCQQLPAITPAQARNKPSRSHNCLERGKTFLPQFYEK